MSISKYVSIITLSAMTFFLSNKTPAQSIPQDDVNLKTILENKKEDLSDYYFDPSFTAEMNLTTKLDKELFEAIVLKEPYGGIDLTGKVAGMLLGGSYKTTKHNGSTTLHINQKDFGLDVEFDKLYDNHRKFIDTTTILYYGKTTFATVDLEGVVKVQYYIENDSLKIDIDAHLGPEDFWDSFKFGVGKLAGEVPDKEEIAGWNKSLQDDFNNAAMIIQSPFMPFILDYEAEHKSLSRKLRKYLMEFTDNTHYKF